MIAAVHATATVGVSGEKRQLLFLMYICHVGSRLE
jgi:hypothetical protein